MGISAKLIPYFFAKGKDNGYTTSMYKTRVQISPSGFLYPIFYDFDFPALDPEWTFRYFYERKIF